MRQELRGEVCTGDINLTSSWAIWCSEFEAEEPAEETKEWNREKKQEMNKSVVSWKPSGEYFNEVGMILYVK